MINFNKLKKCFKQKKFILFYETGLFNNISFFLRCFIINFNKNFLKIMLLCIINHVFTYDNLLIISLWLVNYHIF